MTEKRRPRVSIRERRIQNPFGEPSADIPLKDQLMTPRWFNEDARPGQIARAKDLGWEPVTEEMVANTDRLGAYEKGAAGEVLRGERGREHLMYMPKDDRLAIQDAKTAENNRRMANPHAMRNDALEAYGDSNADGAQVAYTGTVRTTKERIQRQPEVE